MVKHGISVVVPAYNEEDAIKVCLDSLVAQKSKYPFEVVVVDNNSTDKTAKVVRSYADKLNLRLVTEKIKGRGAARARGFEEAKGDIIFSTDADTTLPEKWVERFVDELTEDYVAVTGTCKIDDNVWYKNAIFNVFQPLSMDMYRIPMRHYWLSGFSFAIWRSAYIKAGKLDPTLNALDDVDLGIRVKNLGKIKFIRDLPVVISGRRFRKNFFWGIISYGKPFMDVAMHKKLNVYMDDIR